MPRIVERGFEAALWRSRFLVLIAVLGSLAAAIAVLFVATVDAVVLCEHAVGYATPGLETGARAALHGEILTHVVEVVDGYLLATVLLIFAFGLYELFVSDLDEARNTRIASRILVVESLDDLKSRLGKVILMILIVTVFERALKLDVAAPLDLLWLAGAAALVGLALWLTHAGGHKGAD